MDAKGKLEEGYLSFFLLEIYVFLYMRYSLN